MCFRTKFGALLVFAALPALATVSAYEPRDLRQQWDRAKHVAHARVTTVRKLGEVEKNQPLGPCGALYGVELLEQFKGNLPRDAAFTTHQILFPERPLRVGEEILVFLRDLRIRQKLDRPIQDELDSASRATATCGSMETTLYVAMSEENVFPLVSGRSSEKDQMLWLEYRWQASVPSDIQPRREGKCEAPPVRDCVVTENPLVAWLAVRNLLKSWASR